jgi:hypothetical protein
VLNLSGPGAFKQNHESLESILVGIGGLNLDSVEILYRYADLTKWFLKLKPSSQASHGKTFCGRKLKSDLDKVTIEVVSLENDKSKGFIHRLPPTFKDECVQKIAAGMTGDLGATVSKDRKKNKWCFQYKPQKEIKVPHYMSR